MFSPKWSKLTNITDFELILSIVSACFNSIAQITKLYLEAKACNERLAYYCLNNVMARVGWVPFLADFLALSQKNNNGNRKNVTINYDIHYKVCGYFKNKVDFLFYSVTLRYVYLQFTLYCSIFCPRCNVRLFRVSRKEHNNKNN